MIYKVTNFRNEVISIDTTTLTLDLDQMDNFCYFIGSNGTRYYFKGSIVQRTKPLLDYIKQTYPEYLI